MHLAFVASESTFAYFRATRAYLEAHGKPLAYLVRKAGQWWVQRGDAVDFLWRHGRDPLGACHRLSPTWTPCPLTA
jgi:hypothetical protein